MELHLPNSIRLLFPLILVLIGYKNIFINWELPLFGFNEIEDLGRILIVLGISACENALLTVFLWWLITSMKKISSKQSI